MQTQAAAVCGRQLNWVKRLQQKKQTGATNSRSEACYETAEGAITTILLRLSTFCSVITPLGPCGCNCSCCGCHCCAADVAAAAACRFRQTNTSTRPPNPDCEPKRGSVFIEFSTPLCVGVANCCKSTALGFYLPLLSLLQGLRVCVCVCVERAAVVFTGHTQGCVDGKGPHQKDE